MTHDVNMASDRSAHEKIVEIEITPQMIEAGEEVLLCALGGAVSSCWNPDELAKKVFLAMEAAREFGLL